MSYIDLALMTKALGDQTRLQIFDMLKSGKHCACKLLEAFNITQPTLSYHMKMLTDSGLVVGEKDGKWIYYSINETSMAELVAFIDKPLSNSSCCSCE